MIRERVLRPSSREKTSPYRVKLENLNPREKLEVHIKHESLPFYEIHYFKEENLFGSKNIYFNSNEENGVINIDWCNVKPYKIKIKDGIFYKYRSLENFLNFIDIILKNKLYAPTYTELNDPLEGKYSCYEDDLDELIREKIRQEKGDFRLCSLSLESNNIPMWTHYADESNGVVIELKVTDKRCEIRPIKYEGIQNITSYSRNTTAQDILCYKLPSWNYEKEVRVFTRDKMFIDIKIKRIITGVRMKVREHLIIKELIEKINPDIVVIKAEDL